ncbi:sensor histidine kinase [Paenibacillus sp. NFR01]|uniref:cache domain-containing sensor histidine kinase n=1 Tax=Paenibacillus sp. NFR01 TaxID=1566279 RepID=UPI0008D2FAE3|nr:sensor histidine kinase [Paenibacillus sp. NFR01]SET08713.1 two-component system, sensor histidine kinase YesM [Paenibacillus sp. NFR01]
MHMRRWLERMILRMTRTMNLRRKIVAFYGLVVFIPTVILGIGAGYLALQNVRSNYMLTINEAVRQTAQSVDFRKQSYDLLVNRTGTDGELISRLSRTYENWEDQLASVNYVDRSFQVMSRYLTGIENFRIYHSNATLLEDGGLLWKPGDRPLPGGDEETWYDNVMASPFALQWSDVTGEHAKLIVSRKIMNTGGYVFGAIYMLLDYDSVFGELMDHPFSGEGSLFLLDEHNRVVAASDRAMIGRPVAATVLAKLGIGNGDTDTVTGDGEYFAVRQLNGAWKIAALVQMHKMEQQSATTVYSIVAITVFFLFMSMFLVMIVLKNVVLRIRKLGNRMSDIAEGDFNVLLQSRSRDEVGDLEVMFNQMAGRLGSLIELLSSAKLKEKESAFQALQAQINPHFIYNSLSLLQWRALDQGDRVQVEAIEALTTFYRLALDNTSNITLIRSEIEHVRAYLDIQQLRYPDRVRVAWDIDESVWELYSIKMILQPIVENAYIHGRIFTVAEACISISIRREGPVIRFVVEDNGTGIDPDTLVLIRRGEKAGKGNGFGLMNIKERLALYFGEAGKLWIDGGLEQGTVVVIELPACTEKPELYREG